MHVTVVTSTQETYFRVSSSPGSKLSQLHTRWLHFNALCTSLLLPPVSVFKKMVRLLCMMHVTVVTSTQETYFRVSSSPGSKLSQLHTRWLHSNALCTSLLLPPVSVFKKMVRLLCMMHVTVVTLTQETYFRVSSSPGSKLSQLHTRWLHSNALCTSLLLPPVSVLKKMVRLLCIKHATVVTSTQETYFGVSSSPGSKLSQLHTRWLHSNALCTSLLLPPVSVFKKMVRLLCIKHVTVVTSTQETYFRVSSSPGSKLSQLHTRWLHSNALCTSLLLPPVSVFKKMVRLLCIKHVTVVTSTQETYFGISSSPGSKLSQLHTRWLYSNALCM